MAVTDNNEQQFSINYFGNKVVREHCPLTGLKCCCERHICKAKKYQCRPCERTRAHIQPNALTISKAPFDGESIHKTSYTPCHPQKPVYVKHLPHGIHLNKGNFEKSTIQSSSFQKWDYIPKTRQIQPCTRDILGPIGPLENTTNYRDDYGPQPYSKRRGFIIKSNIFCDDKPFDDTTTNKITYLAPENFVPAKNLQPEDYFSKYCRSPMADTTTQKSDYVEFKVPYKKVDTSNWNSNIPYKIPKISMDGTSMYKHSYTPSKLQVIQEPIPLCEIPKYRNTITNDTKFYDTSIYANDFPAKYVEPDAYDKLAAIRTSIHFGNNKFYGQSIHNLIYQPWNIKPSVPKKLDCGNALRNLGEMDLITTHKKDFGPKSYSKRPLETIAKSHSFDLDHKPLDCRTTSGLSYHPQVITKRPPIVKPKPILCPSDKFDGDTLYKTTFVPWPLSRQTQPSPETFTNFKIGNPFYGTTTYNNAYRMPEQIVEEDCEKPCGCEYPTQCLDINVNIPHNA